MIGGGNTMRTSWFSWTRLLLVLFLIFLYLPILVLILMSFSSSRFGAEWTGFSLVWYRQLLHEPMVWAALFNSLVAALTSTILATLLGTLAAFAIHFYRSRLQILHRLTLLSPLTIPDVLMGVSLLLLFVSLSIDLSMLTIIIAHTTFSISYVFLNVASKLSILDYSLIEAARDLGASSRNVVCRIIFPHCLPAIISGALLAFTLSLDDFVITFFVVGPGSSTLPIYVYSMIKFGSPSIINALSTVMILVGALAIFAHHKTSKESIL